MTRTSASVTILNTAPSISSADLDGSSVDESGSLTCSASGWSDDDGDAEGYSYSWTADGVEVSTSATITGSDFEKGQTLVCTITPNDGEEDGDGRTTPKREEPKSGAAGTRQWKGDKRRE